LSKLSLDTHKDSKKTDLGGKTQQWELWS